METSLEISQSRSQQHGWYVALHLSALAGYFIPLGNILAPLFIWLIKKDESAEIRRTGALAVNFHITVSFIFLALGLMAWSVSLFVGLNASAISTDVTMYGFVAFAYIVVCIIFALVLGSLYFVFSNGIRAYKNQEVHYPFAIPFIKNKESALDS